MNWENQSQAECESGMDAALAAEKKHHPVPSDPMFGLVRVAAIMPFFRYAVGPESQHSPAIPYLTRKGAEKCFDEVTRELPWDGAIMYQRTWRGLVAVREYKPNEKVEVAK